MVMVQHFEVMSDKFNIDSEVISSFQELNITTAFTILTILDDLY